MSATKDPSRSWQLQCVAWYTLYYAAEVAVLPFLRAFYALKGLNSQQLGIIGALNPWLSLPASMVWGAAADRWDAHRPIMLACLLGTALVRCMLMAADTFASILAVSLAVTLLDTPTGVLADAAVVAAIREGEYGRFRKWGAVGWGGMAVVSGALIDHVGMGAAFALGVALVLPALVCGWNLHQPMREQLAARRGALARLQWVQAKRAKARKALAARQLSPVSERGEGSTPALDAEWEEAAAEAARVCGDVLVRGAESGSSGEEDQGSRPLLPQGREVGEDALGGGEDGDEESRGSVRSGPSLPALASMSASMQGSPRHSVHSGGRVGGGIERGGGIRGVGGGEGGALTLGRQGEDIWHRRRSVELTPLHLPASPLLGQQLGEGGEGILWVSHPHGLDVQGDPLPPLPPFPHGSRPQGCDQVSYQGHGRGEDCEGEVEEGGGERQPLLSLPPPTTTTTNNPCASAPALPCTPLKGGGRGPRRPGRGVTVRAHTPSMWDNARRLASCPPVVVFFFTACLMGFGFGAIDSFLFVFLQELGASDTLMGLTLTVTCVAEVPVFQVQGWLMAKLGTDVLLDATVLTYAVRMLLYAALPAARTPWAVLPVEVLHGVTFGLGWGVGTTRCRSIAPPGMAATMQGLFQGCYFGLGYGVGSLVGGLLSQRHGYPTMYVACACIMCGGWALILMGRVWASRHVTSPPRSPATTGTEPGCGFAAAPASAADGIMRVHGMQATAAWVRHMFSRAWAQVAPQRQGWTRLGHAPVGGGH